MTPFVREYEKKYRMLKALYLSEKGQRKLNQLKLARETKLHVDQVSKLLPDLEEAGLVERKGSKDDEREKLVTLTPEGRRLIASLELSRESLPTGKFEKGRVLEKIEKSRSSRRNPRSLDADSEFSFPDMPNTMIGLARLCVMSEVGVKLETRKDRHAKDALERILRDSLDTLIVPEPLRAGRIGEYIRTVDPENAIARTEEICRMGTSLLYLVDISSKDRKAKELYMLGGAAAEEYAVEFDENFRKQFSRFPAVRKREVERVENPEELLQIGIESLENEKPVCLLVKPPQNIIFSIMSGAQKTRRSRDEVRVRNVLPYRELRDCIIARRQFVEEHPDIVWKIGEIAEMHESKLKSYEVYSNYSAIIQLGLLFKVTPEPIKKIEEISEWFKICEEGIPELASRILDPELNRALSKYFRFKISN